MKYLKLFENSNLIAKEEYDKIYHNSHKNTTLLKSCYDYIKNNLVKCGFRFADKKPFFDTTKLFNILSILYLVDYDFDDNDQDSHFLSLKTMFDATFMLYATQDDYIFMSVTIMGDNYIKTKSTDYYYKFDQMDEFNNFVDSFVEKNRSNMNRIKEESEKAREYIKLRTQLKVIEKSLNTTDIEKIIL